MKTLFIRIIGLAQRDSQINLYEAKFKVPNFEM